MYLCFRVPDRQLDVEVEKCIAAALRAFGALCHAAYHDSTPQRDLCTRPKRHLVHLKRFQDNFWIE